MNTASGTPHPCPADPPADKSGPPTDDPHAAHGRPVDDESRSGTAHPDLRTARPGTTGVIAAAAAAVTAAIPWSFPPGGGPTTLDLAVGEQVDPRLDPRPWVAEVLTLATDTWFVLALLCGGAAWFAWQRRWWETITVVVAPEIAVAVNTVVLKPWWGRPLHDYLAYPSGHTVHFIAVVTALVLVVHSIRARVALAAYGVLGWCAGALGMIALDYHVMTDILGGAAAGVALTIALYWISVRIRRLYTLR